MVKTKRVFPCAVDVTRDSTGWVATFAGEAPVGGGTVRAGSLVSLQERVQDLVAERVRPTVEVEFTYRFDFGQPHLEGVTADIRRRRAELAAAEARLFAETDQLARELVAGQGLSFRDAAVLLGVSHQWIGKLLAV